MNKQCKAKVSLAIYAEFWMTTSMAGPFALRLEGDGIQETECGSSTGFGPRTNPLELPVRRTTANTDAGRRGDRCLCG